MRGLTNISVKKYRSVLSKLGLHKVRTKGGLENHTKENILLWVDKYLFDV